MSLFDYRTYYCFLIFWKLFYRLFTSKSPWGRSNYERLYIILYFKGWRKCMGFGHNSALHLTRFRSLISYLIIYNHANTFSYHNTKIEPTFWDSVILRIGNILSIDKNRHRCYTALTFGPPGIPGYHSVKLITI